MDVGFIKGAIAFALIAATGLSTYWLRLRARLLAQRDSPDLNRVQDDLLQLRTDLETRLLEVEERLDFTERRLLSGSPRVESSKTPRALTPV